MVARSVKLTAFGLCACLMPFGAVAQDVDCANAEAQVELTFCAESDWKDADADLNATYKLAMAASKRTDTYLDAKDRGAADYLLKAQREWITYRDDACAAEGYSAHGGTAEPMIIYDCRARLTRERTDSLAILADSAAD